MLVEHLVIHHGGHGRTFAHGIAGQLSVVVRARGFDPVVDAKGLIFERVGQLVGHHRLLFVDWNPIRNVKLFGLGIVEAGDLVGEHVKHERVERKVFGNQAEGLQRLGIGVTFGVVLVFFIFANQIIANFLFGTQALLQWLLDGKRKDLAHLQQDLVGSLDEVRTRGMIGLRRCCGTRGDRRLSRTRLAGGDSYASENKQNQNGASSIRFGIQPGGPLTPCGKQSVHS